MFACSKLFLLGVLIGTDLLKPLFGAPAFDREVERTSRQVRWPDAGGAYHGDSGGNSPTTTTTSRPSTTTSSSDDESSEELPIEERLTPEELAEFKRYYPSTFAERSRARGKATVGQRVKSAPVKDGTGNPAIVGPVVPVEVVPDISPVSEPMLYLPSNRRGPIRGSNFLPPNGDDCRDCTGADCLGCDLPGPRCYVLAYPQRFIEELLACCENCSDDVRDTGCKCDSDSICESFMRRYPEWRQQIELQKRKKLQANRGPVYGPFGKSGNHDNDLPPPPPPGSAGLGVLATSLGVASSILGGRIRHDELRSTRVKTWPEPEEPTVEFVRRSAYDPESTEFVVCPLEEYSGNISNL